MTKNNRVQQFFATLLNYPKLILLSGLILIAVFGSQLPKMKIDTTIEAFIPPGHSSLVVRDKVREIFGLSDPIVIALTDETGKGIFTPQHLNFIIELSDSLKMIRGIDPEKITSIATENNIEGTADGLNVKPFLKRTVLSQSEADSIMIALLKFHVYAGNLVSKDGTTTLIIAELSDKIKYGQQAYHDVELLSKKMAASRLPQSTQIHVAGEGGVVAYQGTYIDKDAKRMTPLAFLSILLVLIISYRTFRGLYLPILVIAAAVVGAMGIMAATGTPMYLVSNVIPVILIAISVADAIHILGQYYENVAKHPHLSSKELATITMTEMWKPVVLTSVTDIFGFLALGLTSLAPPMQAVGIFASVGALIALVYSLTVIPAILVLTKPRPSRAFSAHNQTLSQGDIFGKAMRALGKVVLSYPVTIIFTMAVVSLVGVIGATKIKTEEASIDSFNTETEIYKADRLINKKMNGSNSFDIMIETDKSEGLFDPGRLRKIEKLQTYLESQPHVGGTTSIVDFIKQMNLSLNEGKPEYYVIPDNAGLIAQYFLLYSASSDPSDFENYVDYDYRLANLRVTMNDGHYSAAKATIVPTNEYLTKTFNEPGMKATIAGWMNVFYYWLKDIPSSHVAGVLISLILVFGVCALSFRSAMAGLYTVLPVCIAILVIYAIMGFFDIHLNSATTMMASIALGVAVDFAIHLIDRVLFAVKYQGQTLAVALEELFPSTGRALLFNFSAVGIGFGMNMASSLPPFVQFGLLLASCITASFVASIVLIPALLKIHRPRFIVRYESKSPL